MTFFQLNRNIQVRIIAAGLARMAITAITPYMAIYFAERLGAQRAGGVLTFQVMAAILAGLSGGYAADHYGRKRIMTIALLLCTFGYGGMALASSPWLDSTWITFATFILAGIGSGLMGPAAEAMLIDSSTSENRAYIYALDYWSVNLSLTVGAVLGGALYQTHRGALFLVMMLLNLASLGLIVGFITETALKAQAARTERGTLRNLGRHYRSVVADRQFLIHCIAGLLIMALEFQIGNHIGIRISRDFVSRELHLGGWTFALTGVKMLSVLQLANTVMIILAGTAVTRWMKRFSPISVLTAGILIYAAGYASLAISRSLWPLLGGAVVAALGELMQTPIRLNMMADLVSDTARSSYMAVYDLFLRMAQVFGALGITLGAVLSAQGMSALYLLTGIVALMLLRWATSRAWRVAPQ